MKPFKPTPILCFWLAPLLFVFPAIPQEGTFTASESWSVTMDYSDWATGYTGTQHFTGTQTGKIVITGGQYVLVDQSGVQWGSPGNDLVNRSIYSSGSGYQVNGSYVFGPAFGATARGIVFLGGFVASVPLVDGEVPAFYNVLTYSGSGTDLSAISGGGHMFAGDLNVTVSSTLSLRKVVGPPTILQQPTNQTVFAGQDAGFTVLAGGDGPLSYFWRKGAVNLPGKNASSLTLTNVQISDAAAYSVVVSNSGGQIISAPVALTVQQPPPPWVEGWESALPGIYVPSSNSVTSIIADKGRWVVVDTVSLSPECGPTQNHADITYESGRKFLKLVSAGTNSFCAENISVSIDQRTSSSFPIPLLRSSQISFFEQGSLDNPMWNGLFGCIAPPCGDTTLLHVTDNHDNNVVYLFQRATNYVEHALTNGPSNYGYREIFLDPAGGNFARNLYDDLQTIAGAAGVGTSIQSIELGIASRGWAVVDDLRIGSSSIVPDPAKPSVAITTPLAGQRLSNAVATVRGTAGDNVQVADVFCQINGGGWIPAFSTNGWTNWMQSVSLLAGTNTIQVFAVDLAGNYSPTNTVRFSYVIDAPLVVQLNGKGTITPNYNGQLLEVGRNYAMTAGPVLGYAFTNWTGSQPTNNATLTFMMTSNLAFTANFVDTTRPTVALTAPTAGQRWSNQLFTVRGTASDNTQVAQVFYQLNRNDWEVGYTTNGWTNWAVAVSLAPGTNTVAAYAVDPTGNRSITNRVSLDWVVTNQLFVRVSGLGTISPNYSNAWLEVGRNYNLTATPSAGFAFGNWTISTNWLGNLRTNGMNLQFTMASNLTLQATFVDVTKPTLTVSSPVTGQHMTNALATLRGAASDNWKVSGVWYQLNGNEWNLATTTNGWTNWTTTVKLAAGTNTARIYAVDLGGNFSTTNTLSLVSSNTFMLQLGFALAQPVTTNGFNFSLQLSKGLVGHIQASTNLLDWTTLTNLVGSNSTLYFLDAVATNFSRRVYRAVIP